MIEPAFWDASALVPLCVSERTSNEAARLAARFTQVVWWATVVEVHSAVARAHRRGEFTDEDRMLAFERLTALERRWDQIEPSQIVRSRARDLLDRHNLRAADGLQLSAALFWCGYKPTGNVFLTGDTRLSEAALSVGFDTICLGQTQ